MADTWVIETADLYKRYGGVEALTGLNLQVPKGSICGFLGRNGAGKTTAIKVLLGMARKTSVAAHVLGLAADGTESSVEIRRRSAFVSDEKALYDFMAVRDLVRFTASFFPAWRPELESRYLKTFDLPRERRVKDLSRGMRTKLALLLALCRGAELLILDEPTSGLDPAMTEEVLRALVSHAGREGMSIFFSSHQIADVEQIADHLVIIDRGRTVVEGPLDEVRDRYLRVQCVFDGEAPAAAFRSPGVLRVERRGRILSALSNASVDSVVSEAKAMGAVSIDVVPMTLKEIFLQTVTEEN